LDGDVLFSDVHINLAKGDKTIIYSKDSRASTAFYQIIMGNQEPDSENSLGELRLTNRICRSTTLIFFNNDLSLIDWLRQWANSEEEREEVYIRGFLGKMIFSGEEAFKTSNVLSGGEKVRCMLSKMMMAKANVVLLDEPTNHLDLESITAFNNSLKNFKGNVILTTHDHEFAQTVGNRIIELTPKGAIDRYMTFDEYMTDPKVKELRESMYY
jgi:ATPase subunit of ABC transporter with duplicated ATPase domains